VTRSQAWSFAVSCVRKNKNREISSKANTAFLRNFVPMKILRYTVTNVQGKVYCSSPEVSCLPMKY